VLEVEQNNPVQFVRMRENILAKTPRERLTSASWKEVSIPGRTGKSKCYATNLGEVVVNGVSGLRCFAISFGGIDGYQRGVMVGITSLSIDEGLPKLTELLAWMRSIRLAVRRHNRRCDESPLLGPTEQTNSLTLALKVRPNRRLAAEIDLKAASQTSHSVDRPLQLRGQLEGAHRTLNVVELFAGAGGMGLGFMRAKGEHQQAYRITASAEIHPTYVETLRLNHRYLESQNLSTPGSVPDGVIAMDLRSPSVRKSLRARALERGPVDIVVGGPPCQGFSSANRNSWSSSNPNNALVDAFLDCIALMSPRVLLMENVQGILWTRRGGEHGDLSVASHVLTRLAKMGYLAFPKLLDASWYGVPQNRNRFFLLGIHRDLGYEKEDFGSWGPFPKATHGAGAALPLVTVGEALRDLPRIGNGEERDEMPYISPANLRTNAFLASMRHGAPADVIWDHVTSRHADYVIDRYARIPQGGNWESVKDLMTNYADVSRTHSNIYRRLMLSEPAITIGHYRKSMIVHPQQHRGLSLREAARLQSFPDWFRFAGSPTGVDGGLMHKQQQLANAVCPNVTKAVAEFVLGL
jgi:DNA-cytosine methyltransferase